MIVANQVPLSVAFFRKYWSGLTFPHPEDLPDPRVEPGSSACRQIFYLMSHQGSLFLKRIHNTAP